MSGMKMSLTGSPLSSLSFSLEGQRTFILPGKRASDIYCPKGKSVQFRQLIHPTDIAVSHHSIFPMVKRNKRRGQKFVWKLGKPGQKGRKVRREREKKTYDICPLVPEDD